MKNHSTRGAIIYLLTSIFLLLSFWIVGLSYFNGFELDLGSISVPAAGYSLYMLYWILLGGGAALCMAYGVVLLLQSHKSLTALIHEAFTAPSDQKWIIYASAFAFLIPVTIRFFILEGAPVTDDESCYRFSSELLASGLLKIQAPPDKLFYDRAFMINDTHLYSQYPLGWPLLMVPGALLSVSGYINSVYCAVGLVPLFLVLRRLFGSGWARLGTLLYLGSPMIMAAAATEMSHTSCFMALAWTLYFSLRTRENGANWRIYAGVTLFFSLAIFIRPPSSLGLGLPMLLYAAWNLKKVRGFALAETIGLAVPAILLGGAFLYVNYAQNGSPFTLSYQRALAYAAENNFRFSNWGTAATEGVQNFQFTNPEFGIANSFTALLRLNFDTFGWPVSILFLAFAGNGRKTALLWWCIATYFAVHYFTIDSGVDSYGPTHYFEVSLALIVLSVAGIKNLRTRMAAAKIARRNGLHLFPAALCMSLILVNLCGFTPVRFAGLSRIGQAVNTPFRTVEEYKITNAVIFSPFPLASQCASKPTRHYVFWRLNNDPHLKNDILWVNHISVEKDRAFLRKNFPGRKGYVYATSNICTSHVLPLDKNDLSFIPDAL